MNEDKYSPKVQKYLLELIHRKAVSSEAFNDKTFINYLFTQKIDEDYIKNIRLDRSL